MCTLSYAQMLSVDGERRPAVHAWWSPILLKAFSVRGRGPAGLFQDSQEHKSLPSKPSHCKDLHAPDQSIRIILRCDEVLTGISLTAAAQTRDCVWLLGFLEVALAKLVIVAGKAKLNE